MLFERVRREVRTGGSGRAGSRAEILGFGGRPAPVCVHIKELIISGPFRGPEGSQAIRAVLGAVRGRPGTGRFRKVRTEEFHRRSDVHTYKSKF